MGEIEKLRHAREAMNEVFPLTPVMWEEWTRDEASISTGYVLVFATCVFVFGSQDCGFPIESMPLQLKVKEKLEWIYLKGGSGYLLAFKW